MNFPTLVYRCPGSHQCHGGTFDYKQVNSSDELAASIRAGWYPTLPFAQDPENFDLEPYIQSELQNKDLSDEPKKRHNSPDPHPDFKDLTRDDLEERARSLGIRFNSNIKDETLAERIIQALED